MVSSVGNGMRGNVSLLVQCPVCTDYPVQSISFFISWTCPRDRSIRQALFAPVRSPAIFLRYALPVVEADDAAINSHSESASGWPPSELFRLSDVESRLTCRGVPLADLQTLAEWC